MQFFAGNDEEGYRYVIGSHSEDVRVISEKLNEAFQGRGGGKPQMVQGSLKGTAKNISEISVAALEMGTRSL